MFHLICHHAPLIKRKLKEAFRGEKAAVNHWKGELSTRTDNWSRIEIKFGSVSNIVIYTLIEKKEKR